MNCTNKSQTDVNKFTVELLSDELIMDHCYINLYNLARTVALPIRLESLKEIKRINFHGKNQFNFIDESDVDKELLSNIYSLSELAALDEDTLQSVDIDGVRYNGVYIKNN